MSSYKRHSPYYPARALLVEEWLSTMMFQIFALGYWRIRKLHMDNNAMHCAFAKPFF